jgi:tetratricopeptide (TPR) repeat protein
MIGHRLMGTSLLFTGDIEESREQFDAALALYDPAEHRPLATRFGVDHRVSVLAFRSIALLMLGYPDVALADADRAVKEARDIGHAATLMFALSSTTRILLPRGNYSAANLQIAELLALADEKGSLYWKAEGMFMKGLLLGVTGKTTDATEMITASITALRSTDQMGCRFVWHVWQ